MHRLYANVCKVWKIATIFTKLSSHFSIIFVFVDISYAQHTSLPRAGKFPRGTVHPISPRYFSLVVDTLVYKFARFFIVHHPHESSQVHQVSTVIFLHRLIELLQTVKHRRVPSGSSTGTGTTIVKGGSVFSWCGDIQIGADQTRNNTQRPKLE